VEEDERGGETTQGVQDAVASEVDHSVAKQPRSRGKKGRGGKDATATPAEQPVTLPIPAPLPETVPAQEVVVEKKEKGRRNKPKKTEASADKATSEATSDPSPPSGSNPTKGKALLSLLRSSPEN
jgi:hypothetical protein